MAPLCQDANPPYNRAEFRREDAAAAKLDKLAALLSRSGNTTPETVAVFADLLGLPTAGRYSSPPTDPRERRELILSTLVGQLDALARYRPVLFVFEDAHYAHRPFFSGFRRQ